MKKFIFISLMLMMGLSTFAQRVNQQGKKLVKSITTDYQTMPYKNCSYQFSYDDDANLTQMQCILQPSTQTFKKEGKKISFISTSNHYKNNIFDLTLNEKGYLTTFKDIRTHDNKNYGYTQYDYKYDYDNEIGGNTIVDFANSEWIQDEGEQPKLFSQEIHHRLYSYFKGELQYGHFVEFDGELNELTPNEEEVHYTDLIDDTSVNLIWFLVSCDLLNNGQILLLTEWCPTTAIKLPKDISLRFRNKNPMLSYEYVYENDNLTTMIVYYYNLYHIPSVMCCFTIEYYY